MKTIISTPKAPAAIGPYNQATAFDKLIFTSGTNCTKSRDYGNS